MKRALVLFVLCVTMAGARAAEWLTDLPTALAQAREQNKVVFLEFTGSDWCPYCQALEKKVLASKAFDAYAKEHLILVVADFPQKTAQPAKLKRADAALAKEFKIQSYPTVLLLGPGRKVLKTVAGYGGGTPERYLSRLELKEQ
jgi:thiol-disulfide isomerase/thioredoxin